MQLLAPDVTLIIAVWGDYCQIEAPCWSTLKDALQAVKNGCRLLVALDSNNWLSTPMMQVFLQQCPQANIIIGEGWDHPGRLLNRALREITGEFVTVAWPGCNVVWDELRISTEVMKVDPSLDAVFLKDNLRNVDVEALIHGLLLSSPALSIHGAVFKTSAICEIEPFDESVGMQTAFSWSCATRFTREHKITVRACDRVCRRWNPESYPNQKWNPISETDIHERVVRPHGDAPSRTAASLAPERLRPISVKVIGGVWDHMHAQLCFFNYFETPVGLKTYRWTYHIDEYVAPDDLKGADVVIICRGRKGKVKEVIDHCAQVGIPTLYMIDDNWLTVAKDWPVYASIFAVGAPEYETFVYCLRRCNAVVVYSRVLAEYVRPYVRKLYVNQVNITPSPSGDRQPSPPPGKRDRFLIGYSGSTRFSSAGFEALSRFLSSRDDVDAFFMSTELPEALRPLHAAGRVKTIPYGNYHYYRKVMSQAKVDVLLAPLDRCPTSFSKCPNKFLEITAAGAVGAYSNCPPYSDVINILPQPNGILVNDDSDPMEAWLRAMTWSYDNRPQLETIFRQAEATISRTFSTQARQSEFDGMIRELMMEARK